MAGADSLVVVKEAQLRDDIREYEIVLHNCKDPGSHTASRPHRTLAYARYKVVVEAFLLLC